MIFPALNISVKKWLSDDVAEYVIYDDYIYTSNESEFTKFYKNQLYCDGEGDIYKVVEKAEMKESWRNWFRFLPNVWKTKIVFENVNQRMDLEVLRNYLLERISDLEQNDFTKEWKSDIVKAKNHATLINDR